MLLMIDNYDSFTYNIVQYFAELGQEVLVRRNDDITPAEIEALKPQYLVIGPGPCSPREAGISVAAIQHFAGKLPIMGVCLGHQAIGEAFGGRIVHAQKLMHGKISPVHHVDRGVFRGLPNPVACRISPSKSCPENGLLLSACSAASGEYCVCSMNGISPRDTISLLNACVSFE